MPYLKSKNRNGKAQEIIQKSKEASSLYNFCLLHPVRNVKTGYKTRIRNKVFPEFLSYSCILAYNLCKFSLRTKIHYLLRNFTGFLTYPLPTHSKETILI